VRTYPMDQIEEIVKKEKIEIGILVIPGEQTEEIAERLINSGVTGILNYTPRPLSVPSHVFLEEYDMITSIEKVAYFSKRVN